MTLFYVTYRTLFAPLGSGSAKFLWLKWVEVGFQPTFNHFNPVLQTHVAYTWYFLSYDTKVPVVRTAFSGSVFCFLLNYILSSYSDSMATNSNMEGSDVSPEDAPEDDGNNSFANEVKSFQNNKNLFKVSRHIQEVSSARINDVMNKLNLHLTEFPQSRTGERTLSQNSKQVVDKHWRLLNFVFRKCGYNE